jgi:hypothetical protein
VFEYAKGAWSETTVLTAPNAARFDSFGSASVVGNGIMGTLQPADDIAQ